MEAPKMECINGNRVDVDCQSDISAHSLMLPIQQAMIDDFEKMRPMPDFCNAAECFEGQHCAVAPAMTRDVTDVPTEEMKPCCAYWSVESCGVPGQTICSLFCGFPSCIGCVGQCTLICCMCKFVNCKLLDCKDEDSKCCACMNCNCFMTLPNKALECQSQTCCIDYRSAGPCCTKKVPCLCTVLGFSLCADWKCVGCKFCTRLGDLIPRMDERAGKSPDATPAGGNVTVTVNVAK